MDMDQYQIEVWDKIDAFLLRCGSIHEPYPFCVEVLQGLKELVPYDAGVFITLDGNRKITQKYFINISKKWTSLYLDFFKDESVGGYGINADVSEQRDSAFVKVIDWDAVASPGNEFYASYIRPRGLKYSLVMCLFDLDGAPSTSFSLDRLSDRPFSDEQVGYVRRIARHLNNLYKNLFATIPEHDELWSDVVKAKGLTPREIEVAKLLCEGVTPANISRKLHISQGTTNKHIVHIYKKFEVGSRQELLVKLLGK